MAHKFAKIRQGGEPAFAVIPYDDYLQLTCQKGKEAGMLIEKEWNLVKAWRKYLGMSQKVLEKSRDQSTGTFPDGAE